ncbi:hypothetical protein EYB26_009469 [Talaromyces marneffei]|uniref:uncharacterized protein n=1 Tax=Talaromyces marneffei TaxID=37727 RepID=UPI0012A88E50|nr:uncharacterized protein EYB26_009469 [Talaromyces marneffei]QGA21758.1 hypothetical protein EYB26_009469 [Talaromyces marneffei]
MLFKRDYYYVVVGLICLAQPSFQQSTACASSFSQCGGIGYKGATCCPAGWSCQTQNSYYAQCLSGTPATSTGTGTSSVPVITSSAPTTRTTPYRTSTTFLTGTALASHTQVPYTSLECNNADCGSGTIYPDITAVNDSMPWHYSRSTHFGETPAGACGFGLYGMCTTASVSGIDLGDDCAKFCAMYPDLCTDPANYTLRGNFAAPNGNYYTQFWPMLPSLDTSAEQDNYLSCGECFELVRTHPNGTLYATNDAGYSPPIILEIVDSCPCSANTKWCCGPGVDQCQEVSNFTYGCPLPDGSIHLDLSDVAMTRAQAGTLVEGVIPTQYKRVPCPKAGNVYLWLRGSAGPYFFQITAVNAGGLGSIVGFEIRPDGQSNWLALVQEADYPVGHPQERYGAWTLPANAGPINLPMGVRLTSATGEQIVNEAVITNWTAPATAIAGYWYIDLGINFKSL